MVVNSSEKFYQRWDSAKGIPSHHTCFYCVRNPLVRYSGKHRGMVVLKDSQFVGMHLTTHISHLRIADDTLIFSQVSLDCARSIKDVLGTYRLASGQEINFQKSSVAFSKNCCEEIQETVALEMNIQTENKMELYLGLPSRITRSKKELFSSIRHKVWKRINGWNEKILSQAVTLVQYCYASKTDMANPMLSS
ncbi:UNVERIFIED_CONTAM: hypothetical protein Slati_2647600 [Sesamum latifolium]|uniref:Reverse transcriptase n=1 Tax=Sesamum latifolium TaxID=2727402 RepID=A0AAW2VUN3_9LAMI